MDINVFLFYIEGFFTSMVYLNRAGVKRQSAPGWGLQKAHFAYSAFRKGRNTKVVEQSTLVAHVVSAINVHSL